jgi:hypothetical protein
MTCIRTSYLWWAMPMDLEYDRLKLLGGGKISPMEFAML